MRVLAEKPETKAVSSAEGEKAQILAKAKERLAKNEEKLRKEENAKKPGVIVTASGLQYRVIKSGAADGASPDLGSPCSCHYSGKLIDGTEFDSSIKRGRPAQFAPNQVIKVRTDSLALGVLQTVCF